MPTFDAENRLGALSDRVERGEGIIVTRLGLQVAKRDPAGAGFDRNETRTAAQPGRAPEVLVTIIASKICYGADLPSLLHYIGHVKQARGQQMAALTPAAIKAALAGGPAPLNVDSATLSDSQFVRFKNAGRQHASKSAKSVGGIARTRDDRTEDDDLRKWDVAEYGELTGRGGPWGGGSLTNRDHMTANSSNQLRLASGTWQGDASTTGGVKNEGLAITVSGRHHREASYTYGGRTAKIDTPDGTTRMTYGATHPTESFFTEMREMLTWKANHIGTGGQVKNTLRLEMVGAYAFMYKAAVDRGHIKPTIEQDVLLLHWLRRAVTNDDGVARH